MAWAGLLAPAAQAQPAQLATGACAEGGLLGAVEPLAVAVLGGLPGGAVGGAGTAAPWAVEAPPLTRGADAATDVDVVRAGGGRSVVAVDDGGAGAGRGGGGGVGRISGGGDF